MLSETLSHLSKEVHLMYTRHNGATRGVWKGAVGTMLAVALTMGAAPAQANPLYPVEEMNNVLVGSGSDTTYDMMKALDKVYAGGNGCAAIWDPSTDQPRNGTCDPDVTSGTTPYEWVNATHDTVVQQFPVGSGNGIQELCDQGLTGRRNVDFARSSSGLPTTSAPRCTDLMYLAYARDAVSWWHSVDSGSFSKDIVSMSDTVLGAIFGASSTALPCVATAAGAVEVTPATVPPTYTCTRTLDSWDDLNGLTGVLDATGQTFGQTNTVGAATALPAQQLTVYTAQKGSGTVDYWLGRFSLSDFPTNARFKSTVIENLPSAIDPADLNNAIYFMSWGRFRQTNGLTGVYDDSDGEFSTATTALGRVNNVKPIHTKILDSSASGFKFARSVFNVLRYPSDKVLNYVGPQGLLCSPTKRGYTDRASGKTYNTLITETIKAEGFAPLALGNLGGASFANSYGVNADPSTQSSYCRLSSLSNATYTQIDSVGSSVGIVGPSGEVGTLPSAAGGTFVVNGDPMTSVVTSALGIKVGGVYVPATYTCYNQRVESVDCTGDATARYGENLISFVKVVPDADLRSSSLTFVAEDGFGADRAGNDVVGNANLATFDPQTVTVPASVKRKKTVTFSATTAAPASQVITARSLTAALCTVSKSGTNFVVKAKKKKGACRVKITAPATTGYNAFERTAVVLVK